VDRLRNLMEAHLVSGGIIVATTHIDLGMAQARVFEFEEIHWQAEVHVQ